MSRLRVFDPDSRARDDQALQELPGGEAQRRTSPLLSSRAEACCRTIPDRPGQSQVYFEPVPQFAPQHFLYFLPLPHGQGSLRPTFSP